MVTRQRAAIFGEVRRRWLYEPLFGAARQIRFQHDTSVRRQLLIRTKPPLAGSRMLDACARRSFSYAYSLIQVVIQMTKSRAQTCLARTFLAKLESFGCGAESNEATSAVRGIIV